MKQLHMKQIVIAFFLLAVAGVWAEDKPAPKADVIFIHGNVYTGVPGASSFHEVQRAEAVAVQGDRILAVGKTADLMKHKVPATQVIDLGGHFLMPGFNDAHTHLAEGGFTKLEVNLTGSKSLDDLRKRVLEKVATAKPGAPTIWRKRSAWHGSS